jgi:hypothetical protein
LFGVKKLAEEKMAELNSNSVPPNSFQKEKP